MDNLDETTKNSSKNIGGFFKYIFNFEEDNKNNIINIIQYTCLAIIPLLIVLKITRTYVPEVEEEKGSLELLVETLLQIIFIMLSFWFINRMIYYIPTYSGVNYKEFNEIEFIIPVVFILLTMQTKLGDKLRILTDRTILLWNGYNSNNDKDIKKNDNKGNIKIKQPFPDNYNQQIQYNQSNDNATNINNLPNINETRDTNIKTEKNNYQKQQYPDFNKMYQTTTTPLQDAAQPNINEPMAANDGFGGFSPF